MSIGNATWQELALADDVVETWVLTLTNDLSGTLLLSDGPGMDGTAPVFGVVKRWGEIRRRIDLSESRASVENTTVTCADDLVNGVSLWDTIKPGATRAWINRDAVINSYLNGVAASESPVATLRLKSVRRSADGLISLSFEPRSPWDYVKIPSVKSSTGRYFPVAYGDFHCNDSVPGAENYADNTEMFPVPVERVTGGDVLALVGHSIGASGRLHIYEPDTDSLCILVDAADGFTDTTEAYEDAYALRADGLLRHGWRFKPVLAASPGDFTNPERAVDVPKASDTSTGATADLSLDAPLDDTALLQLAFPRALSPFDTDYDVTVVWSATTTGGTPTGYLNVSGSAATPSMAIGGGNQTYTFTVTGTSAPSTLTISAYCYPHAGGPVTVTVSIKDVRIDATAQLDAAADAQANQTAAKVETLYCGGNGLPKSWDSGNPVTEIHEMHRDLLSRFCGYTATPTNWSDLDTARSGWLCRWWALEPDVDSAGGVEKDAMLKILDQAQFEGCFILDWDPAGVARYLWVKASYSAGDLAETLIEGTDCSLIDRAYTDFEDLMTKQEISYQPHPADDSRLLASHTETNATARTTWNIQSLENVAQTELKMLVAEVDAHAAYYDLVRGDLREVYTFTVTKARMRKLAVGDVTMVSGETSYHMVVDEARLPGVLKLTTQEVG